ncbi:hypothetical protein NYF23_00560 [SAR92 clade bacterium H455]|uniref:Uncharacterized protein n=1 Tax=SAR92 clade bacterium H455 TaxID=2974818 RepID=A0ABY5TMN3_9GAMM|nr:hypothetical protein NYF23_00560 [SAR92 clade bacterium H455]
MHHYRFAPVTGLATCCRPEIVSTGVSLGGLSPHRLIKSAAYEISLMIYFFKAIIQQAGKTFWALEKLLGASDP